MKRYLKLLMVVMVILPVMVVFAACGNAGIRNGDKLKLELSGIPESQIIKDGPWIEVWRNTNNDNNRIQGSAVEVTYNNGITVTKFTLKTGEMLRYRENADKTLSIEIRKTANNSTNSAIIGQATFAAPYVLEIIPM